MKKTSGHDSTFAYIGNWDVRKLSPRNGFGICRFDVETGELTLLKSVFPTISVGAACLDSKRNVLYCTDECTTLPGYFQGGGGQVYAFAIDPETGDLTELNHQPSYGTLPSYVAVDATGNYLIITHHTDRVPITRVGKDASGKYRIELEYDDATVVLFPLHEDGSIGHPCDVYKHSGDGGPLAKQTHPQLHSVMMSPSGKLFAVCDKGNDEVLLFQINRQAAKLELCGGKGFKTIPGGSPRYCVFHPTRPYLFVNHETKAVVSSFRYDQDGRLELICTVNALPDDCADNMKMQQSDIRIHPSGKYLYNLIRGISAVSVFAISEQTGDLEKTQTVTLDGTGPRGCAISPDGRFMLIAALTSHDVLVWEIGADGKLSATSCKKISQPNPGSVTFS
jgi:6-phosphogluconolactonase (cycloisomerase 2 family)